MPIGPGSTNSDKLVKHHKSASNQVWNQNKLPKEKDDMNQEKTPERYPTYVKKTSQFGNQAREDQIENCVNESGPIPSVHTLVKQITRKSDDIDDSHNDQIVNKHDPQNYQNYGSIAVNNKNLKEKVTGKVSFFAKNKNFIGIYFDSKK